MSEQLDFEITEEPLTNQIDGATFRWTVPVAEMKKMIPHLNSIEPTLFLLKKLKAACQRIDELTNTLEYYQGHCDRLNERIEIIEDEHLKWEQLISDILGSIKKQLEELKNG